MSCRIKNFSMFKSAETGNAMDMMNFNQGNPTAVLAMPQIITDKETAASIEANTENAGDIITYVSSMNFLTGLLLKGPMQYLYGMIRSMQLLILTSLLDVEYPPHMTIFY
jgi:hypothetical protein